MSKREDFKITLVYPDWIAAEGWTNKGKCDAELAQHEMFQMLGKNGHMKTKWLCIGINKHGMPCMTVGRDRYAALRHANTARHTQTPRVDDVQQIIKELKTEADNKELPKLEHFITVDLPDEDEVKPDVQLLSFLDEKNLTLPTSKWEPPVMNIISPRAQLQCWTKSSVGEHVLWNPSSCAHPDNKPCKITFQSWTDRNSMYDTQFPIVISVPQWHCRTHKEKVTFHSQKIPEDVVSTINGQPTSIFYMNRESILTTTFFFYVVELYKEHNNASAVQRIVETQWELEYNRLKRINMMTSKVLDAKEEKAIKEFCRLDRKTVSLIMLHWWLRFGKPLLDQQLEQICKSSGSVMRSDHTYKIAKSLVTYSTKDQRLIQLRASLLVVMNEKDEIMKYKLCPTDEAKYVVETYTSILMTTGKEKKSLPRAIATDFCSRDAKGLTEMLQGLFGKNYKCDILQDIWHATQRVLRTMPRYHPDYSTAQSALKTIFGRLLDGQYTAKWKLIEAIQDWVTHYEKPSHAAQVDVSDIIKLAASKLGICSAPKVNNSRSNGVVLPITVAEVNRLLKDPTLTGLFRTCNHITQGTSQIESMNSILGSLRPKSTSQMSKQILLMNIGLAVYDQNRKKANINKLVTDHPYPWVIYPAELPDKWTFEDAHAEGFKAKSAHWTWEEGDIAQLKKILQSIHNKDDYVHTKDPYHWISHHQFDGRIPRGCIKRKIISIANAEHPENSQLQQ